MKANQQKKQTTLGEFIMAAYDAWGKRRARGAVRLAIETHLVEAEESKEGFLSMAQTDWGVFKPPRLKRYAERDKGRTFMLGTVLLIILILALLGAFPTWPYSRKWGYGPSGGVGLLLVIVIILLLADRI